MIKIETEATTATGTTDGLVDAVAPVPSVMSTDGLSEIGGRRRLSLPGSCFLTSPVGNLAMPNLESRYSEDMPAADRSQSVLLCEIDSLKEALHQALDDKADLIEEALSDRERIRTQKHTIEVLTKRVREFEMSRNMVVSSTNVKSSFIKQLNAENNALTRQVNKLVEERDKLEKKIIDLKIKYTRSYLQATTSNNTSVMTSTDEDDNDLAVFTTFSAAMPTQKILKPNKKSNSVWSWFSRSKGKTTTANNSPSAKKTSSALNKMQSSSTFIGSTNSVYFPNEVVIASPTSGRPTTPVWPQ